MWIFFEKLTIFNKNEDESLMKTEQDCVKIKLAEMGILFFSECSDILYLFCNITKMFAFSEILFTVFVFVMEENL